MEKIGRKFEVFKNLIKVDMQKTSDVLDKASMFKITKTETKERYSIKLSFIEPRTKPASQIAGRRSRLIDKE